MSYSRWTGTSVWYTFWNFGRADETVPEDRDNAVFTVCAVADFTAKQLRDDMETCIAKVVEIEPHNSSSLEALRECMRRFLVDVDARYPEVTLDEV